MVDRATNGEGPAGLGDQADWRCGLEQYLASAQEDGRLNALGARMAHESAVSRLTARLEMNRYFEAHPGLSDRQLAAPIVIIGGWRTGTTYLFRMMATDLRLRAPLPVELIAPWQTAALDPGEREAHIDASAVGHDMLHMLNPEIAIVHDSGARLPEECVLGMGTTLRNWAFSSNTRLDSYAEWLAGQSFATEYAQHRRNLVVLDDGDGRRWLLKAPAHTAELDHLAATYPGACIVHLHRDIVETVTSGASLFATFRSTYSDHVDGHDVGRFQTEQTELWLRRALAFRDSPAAATVTCIDIDYTDLVADPEAVLRRVYTAAGLDLPDTAAMINNHHRTQPRNAKGTHRYRPEAFGIDADTLRERMTFYTQRIPSSNGRP
ncbi:sulfotransferase family protein [[Mycobacterium] nativiensis]|uniref:sulfotransferase family protein n=1 Tax=[Mycobacterium] nativiensis TaxID=2855503 RepID=UPI0038B4D558